MADNDVVNRLKRLSVAASAAALLGMGTVAGRRTRRALGGRPTGARLARIQRSPQYRSGAFHNPRTGSAGFPADQRDLLERYVHGAADRRPPRDIPVRRPIPVLGEAELHVTWLGHAGALLELDGVRVLLDPVWSERCSPFAHVGPRRLHPVPAPLAELLPVDVVVISHDHYDHLDMETVVELARLGDPLFLVPLGVGAHLERWSISPARIVELDWGESHDVGPVRFAAVAAQHFSGRGLRRDATLWASWVVAGPAGRIFFSGDTGYFDGYAALADSHGPFDAALMAAGMYDPSWPAIHLTPEEAVRASVELRVPLVVPIHWCTFTLAPHPWAEPVERLLAAAAEVGLACVVPRVGERVRVAEPPGVEPWWRP